MGSFEKSQHLQPLEHLPRSPVQVDGWAVRCNSFPIVVQVWDMAKKFSFNSGCIEGIQEKRDKKSVKT